MKYVRITVDDVTYNLTQTIDGSWVVTNRAPKLAGDYLLTVTITTDAGQDIILDIEDEELLHAMTLLVRNGTTELGQRMINYYPQVIKIIEEFQALIFSEGFEFDFLNSDITLTLNNAYLATMDEERINQWEIALGITPNSEDTLEDRRETIIATVRGTGKLNTDLINSIVNSFTGGTALSYIQNSVLHVEISPPPNNKQYRFSNVEKVLQTKVPAHIGLIVERNYATWGEVKDNFASWQAIANLDNWESLKLYVAPQ